LVKSHPKAIADEVKIVQLAEIFDDPAKLREQLEGLYVQGGKYELRFHRTQLAILEKIFDQIISEHGIRSADFIYCVDISQGNHAEDHAKSHNFKY
jgi:hypothetical protein